MEKKENLDGRNLGSGPVGIFDNSSSKTSLLPELEQALHKNRKRNR